MRDDCPQHPDDIAIDKAVLLLKSTLAADRELGRVLWQDKEAVSAESLALDLRRRVYQGDALRVALIALQLLIRGQAITRIPPPMDYPMTVDKLNHRLDGFTEMDHERDAMERRGRAERRSAPR